MAIKVSFNGRQPRNPIVRVVCVLLTLMTLVLALVIGAAVVLPLIGVMLALGLLAAIVLVVRSAFRGKTATSPLPPPAAAPRQSDPEIVEDDRVARAKPVERV